MNTQLRTTATKGVKLAAGGLASWPYWGAMLVVLSIVYKLNWLDHQLNVGGMNQWKWKVNYGAMVIATFWVVWLREAGSRGIAGPAGFSLIRYLVRGSRLLQIL
ncbi:hypothetical protein OMP38_21235 [Cohnella ginsengisoli]|uniref:Uncharacterized protein n=1 Tax=Cohnella ginsengisoli TaxID=425004 RepID=A0A9X4KJW2_9BACL|nr:hypothetical protein [Cohnella ginsengisoli]MDG0793096.1 hypothetical protein [Cohnella ginsengisoli]